MIHFVQKHEGGEKMPKTTATKQTLNLEIHGIDVELREMYLQHRVLLIRIESLQAQRRALCERVDKEEDHDQSSD